MEAIAPQLDEINRADDREISALNAAADGCWLVVSGFAIANQPLGARRQPPATGSIMKLLFLAHRIPYPPNKGDKIRSYHELQAFIERGHDVHLLAFADDLNDLSYQVELARWRLQVEIVPLRERRAKLRAAANLFSSRPLSLGYFASLKMRRLVKRVVAENDFDAVFVYSSTMAQYA